jgi:hypothetical protein
MTHQVLPIRLMPLLLASLCCLVMSGCGTSPIKYEPAVSQMDAQRAMSTIEKLTMMQHPAWRPDYLAFEYDYMAWDFGQVSSHRSNAVVIPIGGTPVAVGGGRGTTRHSGNRIYFNDIKKVELLSWRRKFKQWYVVSIVGFRGERTHVLRTRHLEDAKSYVDAMQVVLGAKQNSVANSFR